MFGGRFNFGGPLFLSFGVIATGGTNSNSASSSVGMPSPPAHNRKASLVVSGRRPSTVVEEQPSETSALISELAPSPLPRRQRVVDLKAIDHGADTEQSPPDPVCTRTLPGHSRLSSERILSAIEPKTDLAKEFIDQLPTEWSPASSSPYDSSEGSSMRWASEQLAPVIPSVYETTIPAQRTHSYPQLRTSNSVSEVAPPSVPQRSPIEPAGPSFRSLVPRSFSDNACPNVTEAEDKCLLSLESVLVASSEQSGINEYRPELMKDDADSTSRLWSLDTTRSRSASSTAITSSRTDNEDERRWSSAIDEKSLLLHESRFQPTPPPSSTAENLHRDSQSSPVVEPHVSFTQYTSFDSGFKSDRETAVASELCFEGKNYEEHPEVITVGFLADDLLFRTDSACSDHPSLDTTTLDMDLTSRTDVDTAIWDFAEAMSKSIERESIRSVFGTRRLPTPSPRKRTSSSTGSVEQRAIAESTSDDIPISRLTNDSTSQLLTDSFSMRESRFGDLAILGSPGGSEPAMVDGAARGTSLERILATQPEAHYPLAFQSPVVEEESGIANIPDHETDQEAISMAANGSATPTTDLPYSSSVIRGPTFKATGAKPAIWTPGGSYPNGSITESKIDYSSNILSAPVSTPKFLFSSTSNGAEDALNTLSSSLFSPEKSRSISAIDFAKPAVPSKAMTPPNGNHVFVPSSAPPPPPPPPLSSAHSASSSLANNAHSSVAPSKSFNEAPIATDTGRSVVEVPERQTVASLRTAIETKLNGSAPIKSLPSSPVYGSLHELGSRNKGSPLKSKLDSAALASALYRPSPVQRQSVSQKTSAEPPQNNGSSCDIITSDKEHIVSVAGNSSQGLLRDAIDRCKSTTSGSAGGTPRTATPTSGIDAGQGLIPSSIERYKKTTTRTTTTTRVPYEPLANAAKAVDEATADLISTLAIFNQPAKSQVKNYATPLSVTTTSTVLNTVSGVGWPINGRTETPPRPPLPADMASPIPPYVPPPPVGFVMQASPTSTSNTVTSWTATTKYGDGRGHDIGYRATLDRTGVGERPKEADMANEAYTAPRRLSTGAKVQQRPIDSYSIKTENYYSSVPVDSKTSASTAGRQQFLKQADYKQESGRKTPSGLKQQGPNADFHRQWYKMMYKKLHQVPRKDGPNPYTVTYKYPDYASDLEDASEMEVEYPLSDLSYYGTLPNRGAKRYEFEIGSRSVRSKSAGRYETPPPAIPPPPLPHSETTLHSPHGSEVIRSSTPGERYRLQPRSIENYLPGTSSALHYEQEKQRIGQLNIRPQSAVPFVSRYNYTERPGTGFGGSDFGDIDTSIQKRRELSPLSREESRHWYQSVQAGGDAPVTGFRQPAPERRDSIFRTAIAAAFWVPGCGLGTTSHLSAVHGGGSVGARDRRYRSASPARTRTRHAFVQTSGSSPHHEHLPRQSRPRRPCYGTYWKRAFQSSPEPFVSIKTANSGIRHFAPLDIHIDSDDSLGRAERYYDNSAGAVRWSDTCYSFSPPIRSADPGSKMYAFERSKIKNFHLPFFRLTPPGSGHSACSSCSRSAEFETEAYFTYLKQFCEAEGFKLEKGVQANGNDILWLDDYEASVIEKRRLDSEFQRTCESLREALREIEALASPTRLRWKRAVPRDQDQQSIQDEMVIDSASSTMTRSYSLPNGVGTSHPLKVGDRHGQTPSSYAIIKRRRQVPEKYSWVQNGDDTSDHLAAAEELLAVKAAGKMSDSGMKRISSLPQISERTETTGSRPRTAKSIEGLSTADGLDDQTLAPEGSMRQGSQDTTDVSQSMDSMVLDETATVTAVAVAEKRGHASVTLAGTERHRQEQQPFLKTGQTILDHPVGEASVLSVTDSGVSQPHLDRIVMQSHSFFDEADASARAHKTLFPLSQPTHAFVDNFRLPLSVFRPFQPCGHRWDSPSRRGLESGRIRSTGERLNNHDFEFAKLEKELLLEDERRKKQEKELEDQKSRRHGYIPAKSQGLVNDERFEKLISDYSTGDFGRNITATPSLNAMSLKPSGELRAVASALYNFVAQSPREISFRKGDLIKIRRRLDDNWYEGEAQGRVGIFPVNYVDLCVTASSDERTVMTDVNMTCDGQAQTIFDFEGRNGNELPLRKGEFITLIKKIDENWYEGKNTNGRRGIFPASYVKVTKEPFNKSSNFVTAFGRAGSPQSYGRSDDSMSKLLINGMLYDKKHGLVAAGPAERDWPTTSHVTKKTTSTIENGSTAPAPHQTHSQRPTRKEPSSNGTDALGAALSSGHPETFQALFPYKPQNPDELELKETDIVYVVEKCDDGWYIGTSLRTGCFGTFPGNYVRAV